MSTMNPRPDADGAAGEGERLPLVLAVGNLLLHDDAIGLRILEALRADPAFPQERAEMVDGGTQGLALLGVIADRPSLLLLDAIRRGGAPGTVYELNVHAALGMPLETADTAHEGGSGQLLAVARLMGDLPPRVTVIGVEPEKVDTGIGLSDAVAAALPEATGRARDAFAALLAPAT